MILENKKFEVTVDKNSLPFLVILTLILGIGIGLIVSNIVKTDGVATQASSQQRVLSATDVYDTQFISEIYSVLQERYIDQLPSGDKITYEMAKGLINSLGSDYTFFLTPEEAKQYEESKNPDFEGIGVSMTFDGENTLVETVLEGYPAQEVGVKTGDIIAAVDNVDTLGKYPLEIAQQIRGEKGTTVGLKVLRKAGDTFFDTLEFNIIRKRINVDNITYTKIEEGIYKIDIEQFIDETPESFNSSWDSIVHEITAQSSNIKGIVIDLRNNPGGYVFSIKHVLEEFLPDGAVLMKEELKNSPQVVYTDKRSGAFENVKLSVLVNEGSASASEIFAASVQDNNRGKIIGKKTVGKGVEQEMIPLEDGSLLIVVFQKWLTPSNRNITGEHPIVPDFEIDYTENDLRNRIDPQLAKALELVR